MKQVTEGRILDLLAQACAHVKVYGLSDTHRVFDRMSEQERLAFDLFLVRTRDPLAFEAGTCEHRFATRVRRMGGN
jgi:hypothetical protein